MNRNMFYLSLLSVAMIGCSSINQKQAEGGFDYTEISESEPIVVPKDLTPVRTRSDFAISDNINQDGPIGKEMDIRAPSLVLPVATSTRVEENNTKAKVWFDQVLDDRDLLDFIIKAIREELASKTVEVSSLVEDGNVFTLGTDWVHDEKISGIWGFEEIEMTESAKFGFTLEKRPHGRSVALTVDLTDYMKTDETGGHRNINPIDKERMEKKLLNLIIEEVDYQYRLVQRENRLLRANQKLVTIGTNNVDEPAFVVEMATDLLWNNMPVFFDDYGFTVADLDETKRIYFVDFEQPEISLWDKMWGEEAPVIDLPNARYQFVLAPNGEQTTVTLYNENGDVLTLDVLERIFGVIEPALSFRDVL